MWCLLETKRARGERRDEGTVPGCCLPLHPKLRVRARKSAGQPLCQTKRLAENKGINKKAPGTQPVGFQGDYRSPSGGQAAAGTDCRQRRAVTSLPPRCHPGQGKKAHCQTSRQLPILPLLSSGAPLLKQGPVVPGAAQETVSSLGWGRLGGKGWEDGDEETRQHWLASESGPGCSCQWAGHSTTTVSY